MTEYADFSFQHLTMLPNLMGYSSVQLAGNEFTQPNDLSTYTNVVSLNISYNNLRRVWRLPPNLKILEVYNNMIEEIQCNELPLSIVEINISFNLLTNVDAFLRLTNLAHLFIKNNKITSIAQFGALVHLREIDIENNDIAVISDITQFDQHENIQVMNLANNPIASNLTTLSVRSLPYVEG